MQIGVLKSSWPSQEALPSLKKKSDQTQKFTSTTCAFIYMIKICYDQKIEHLQIYHKGQYMKPDGTDHCHPDVNEEEVVVELYRTEWQVSVIWPMYDFNVRTLNLYV